MIEMNQALVERKLSNEYLHELEKIYLFIATSTPTRSSLPSKYMCADTCGQDVQFEIDI
jgi:hypothetical protein